MIGVSVSCYSFSFLIIFFLFCGWDEGHCNNFFEVGAKCEDDPIFMLCTIERKEKGEFWLNSTWRSTLSFTGIILLHFVVVSYNLGTFLIQILLLGEVINQGRIGD